MPDMPSITHLTVLLSEAVDALAIEPAGLYIDATFGRGGHTRSLLGRLGPQGRVVGFDRDQQAIAAGAAAFAADTRLRLHQLPFSQLAEIVAPASADGVLFDLGVSSPQLDQAERGFSFQLDGPLDMRMDQTRGITAAEWLATATEHEIRKVIRDYGEERFAGQIAKTIIAARTRAPIQRTGELARLVASAVRTREAGQNPATRTFQALRIHINQELAQLQVALTEAMRALRLGGRLVVISFHSLEDRIVKNFIRDEARPQAALAHLPLRESEMPQPRLRVIERNVRASALEVAGNPRARSAIMRVAEKI